MLAYWAKRNSHLWKALPRVLDRVCNGSNPVQIGSGTAHVYLSKLNGTNVAVKEIYLRQNLSSDAYQETTYLW